MVTFSGVDLPSTQIRNRNDQRRRRLKGMKKKNAKESKEKIKETKKKKKNSDWMKKFVDCSFLLTNSKDFEMLFELLQLYTEYVVLLFHISILLSKLMFSPSNMLLSDLIFVVH